MTMPKGIMPAVRQLKDFEKALSSEHTWIVLLETRLSQLKQLVTYAKKENKKVLIHIDLIQGLKADEYGVEFIAREIKPEGIISTRGSVIDSVKKYDLIAIQRLFLLDSLSIDSNVRISGRTKADYIEVLPGTMPELIKKIQKVTDIPIIAGGLLTTQEDINEAFEAGSIAVTTSSTSLW
ncbi:glycerol-3-phosphate responsive antiterminator [Pseudogracilibacillus sp. ICA-222130]|uniref:glycerol-3-phosphate responsive antiterminator n=1 Tax=Pseudogracilibacillus sp. ICA-222130 TaxID=3134655 RepID=UPI0030C09FC4